MSKRATFCAVALTGALGFLAGRAFTEEEPPAPGGADLEAFKALAKPGPQHERLMALAGTYEAKGRLWFGPGEPTETTATSTMTALLGGRYLREEIEGAFMDEPFHAVGIYAYDNAIGKHAAIWIDSMGTGFTTSTVAYDEATRTYTFDNVANGIDGQPIRSRDTLRVVSDRELKRETFHFVDGKAQKVGEFAYARK